MSSELENIILTIDTREQNQKRIKAVEDWALGHGAIVEHSALKLCDYSLLGEFRGVPVNLGIEAKSLSDFCSCGYEELKEKLFNSFELYDEVALFIETGNYTYKFIDGIAVIDNPAVRDGSANVCPLAVLEGCCSTLPAYGIHVRQLRSEMQFPDSIWNLLTYTTTPQHTMVKTKEYPKKYKQVLLRFLTPLQVKKIMVSYPNFHWLASASEESLKAVLGSKTGQAVNDFLHCHELETDEWRNNYCRDGTEKDINYEENNKMAHPCGVTCGDKSHPDNFLNRSQDDEGRLAFDAPAKNPVNASGARVEEQPACNGKVAGSTPASGLKCSFADPKKHAECMTPDHFKQLSKPVDDDSIAIMAAIEGYLSGFPEGKTVNEICTHFNMHSGDPDKEKLIKYIKRLAWGEKITSQGNIFKHSSHAEGTILSNHNIPPSPSADTSSHPVISKTTPTPKPGDPPFPPILAVKQATKVSNFPLVPAETNLDLGLSDKPLEMQVRCRACHQVITPEQDDDTGFCNDPVCIAERKKPVHAKNLIDSLKLYLKEPHTVPEIVQEFGVSSGYAFGSCMGGVKAGWLKKVTEQNGKTTFERIT